MQNPNEEMFQFEANTPERESSNANQIGLTNGQIVVKTIGKKSISDLEALGVGAPGLRRSADRTILTNLKELNIEQNEQPHHNDFEDNTEDEVVLHGAEKEDASLPRSQAMGTKLQPSHTQSPHKISKVR